MRVVETYKKQKNRYKCSCVCSATMFASKIITETKLPNFLKISASAGWCANRVRWFRCSFANTRLFLATLYHL